ncbi:MAG: Lar family restriction alleviation protein [Clostridia bacterium]|nr:Lar family restriction alleviation protein [Clostridia bacterium]
MNNLKLCPFCGGKAELIIVPGYFKQGLSPNGWLVKCLKGCCNQMPFMSDHDAIEAWNRRAKEKDNGQS